MISSSPMEVSTLVFVYFLTRCNHFSFRWTKTTIMCFFVICYHRFSKLSKRHDTKRYTFQLHFHLKKVRFYLFINKICSVFKIQFNLIFTNNIYDINRPAICMAICLSIYNNFSSSNRERDLLKSH